MLNMTSIRDLNMQVKHEAIFIQDLLAEINTLDTKNYDMNIKEDRSKKMALDFLLKINIKDPTDTETRITYNKIDKVSSVSPANAAIGPRMA